MKIHGFEMSIVFLIMPSTLAWLVGFFWGRFGLCG
jgi:hypothetical protein